MAIWYRCVGGEMRAISHVVVVEDDPLLRVLLIELIKELTNAQVDAFSFGEEALAFLATNPQIDLVFTDVMLKGDVSGIDVACFVEQSLANTRIIVTSAMHWLRADIPKSAAFLSKPFTVTALEGLIKSFVKSTSSN